jgi:hypothetical protein
VDTHQRDRNQMRADEDIRRIAALATAVQVVCLANQLTLREQSLTVTRPPLPPVELELGGRQPFGFAFTAGHDASFSVPAGVRFVIEHLDVSCGRTGPPVSVLLVTKSRYMFRQLCLNGCARQPSPDENAEAGDMTPILVHETTANTFIFGDGDGRSSCVVPPDTFVQVWGYLEPTHDALSS